MSNLEQLHQTVRGWNETAAPFSSDKTISELFEQQSESTPQAPAVVFDAQVLTYGEFNEQVNQMAHYLIQQAGETHEKLRPDTLVPIMLDRGFHLLRTVHGIFKAGGAYVPIDTALPINRLRFLLADLEAPFLVTTSRVAHRIAEAIPHCTRVLCVDAEQPLIDSLPRRNPTGHASPNDLAYMIYTSGSTGTPKGVMIEHRGLVNRVQWMQAMYPLTHDSTVLHKTPYTFDVSVWELVWPLTVGARLVVARPNAHMHMRHLAELMQRERITDVHFVPSVFEMFVDTQQVGELSSLRRVFCSGEALPTRLTRRFLQALPNCELHNLYGPTEASIDVSFWKCSVEDASSFTTTPIGRPIWNTQLLVLDEDFALRGPGDVGELYIGGVGLARGYYQRPELTSERFVDNPWDDMFKGSRRLYKTGDLARWLPDGNLEYLGRVDFQVKIHGMRIELGEIEHALTQFPPVRAATVIAADNGSKLIAFVEAREEFNDQLARKYLSQQLPEYMIPARIVRLETMPLTTSGKVDRQSLLALLGDSSPNRPQ
jgi:amino acid adenylation domain-containing protein